MERYMEGTERPTDVWNIPTGKEFTKKLRVVFL